MESDAAGREVIQAARTAAYHPAVALLDAAVDGVGLAQVPEPVAVAPVRAGTLQAVLTAYAPQTPGVFLYYPDRRQVLPKLRAFIEHVKARLPDAPMMEDDQR